MRKFVLAALLAAAGFGSAVGSANAVILYRQTFDNNNATDLDFNTIGWEHARQGALASEIINTGNASVAGGGGNPNAVDSGTSIVNGYNNIPAAPLPSPSPATGRGFFQTTTGATNGFYGVAYQTTTSINFTSFDSFDYYSRSLAPTPARLLVRSSGNWYVLDATAATTGGTSTPNQGGDGATAYTHDVFGTGTGNSLGNSTLWKQIVFVPGTALYSPTQLTTITAGALPSLNITGFGLYMTTSGDLSLGTNRFDDYAFNGAGTVIPEPASMAVLGVASLALLRRRRTRVLAGEVSTVPNLPTIDPANV